jgi:hypothetical protein
MTSSRTLILAGCGAALVAVVVALALRLRSDDLGETKRDPGAEEKPLESARSILEQPADLDRCRAALGQVNAYLRSHPDEAPPKLDESRRQELQRDLGLNAGELDELDSRSFTLLDGHHLDLCFLLRDAARSLEVRSRAGRRPTVSQEAEAAFAWVTRQIQLVNPAAEAVSMERGLAPEFVLRCLSFGAPLARALVFLGLLEQLGHQGCLLAFPGSQPTRYWACGVLGETGEIYLFDPRLGIPLPGAGGTVATLAEMQQKDSAVPGRLSFGKEAHYDVTPEQAAASEVHLAPSLSALAPRMRSLEKLLAPGIKVRLAADPEAADRFEKVLKACGHKTTSVKLAPWAARLQRGFYPESDGGTDRDHLKQQALQALILRHLVELRRAVPELPARAEQWHDPPLSWIRDRFLEPFEALLLKRDRPRDLILRGRFDDAARDLGTGLDRLQEQHERFVQTFEPKQIEAWFQAASAAIARRQGPEALQATYEKYGKALINLVQGASARPRQVQAAFLHALCKQELAERVQLRLDCFPEETSEQDYDEAEDLWKETRQHWTSFLDKLATFNPNDRTVALLRPAARAALARAREMIGAALECKAGFTTGPARTQLLQRSASARQSAAAAWEELVHFWEEVTEGKPLPPVLACRFQVRRLSR